MKIIQKRPLFSFCAVFLLISAIASSVTPTVCLAALIALGAAGAAFVIVALVTKKTVFKSAAILSIAATLAFALSFFAFGIRLGGAEKYDGATVESTLKIKETRYSSESFGVYRARFSCGGDSFDVVLTSNDGGLVSGDVISGSFSLSRLTDGGVYNERSSYLPDGVMMSAEDSGSEFSYHDGSFSVDRLLSSMRRSINSRFAGSLSRSAAGLSSALITGDRENVSETLRRDFSRLGVSHLLAISGLHLSVLLFILGKILDALGIRRVPRGILSVVFIVFFAALTGFSVSVLRASLMHIIAIAASLFGRRSDPLTALGAAGAVIVAVNPFSVLDTPLWLSLLSAYACVARTAKEKTPVADTPRKRSFPSKIGRAVVSSIKLTVYITACTLPVTWIVFGEVSVVSPLSNLVFIPAITVYLWASLIFAIVASAGIPAIPLARFIDSFEKLISRGAGLFSGARGIVWSSKDTVSEILVFVIFTIAVSIPFLSGKSKRIRFAAPVAVLCLAAYVAVTAVLRSGTADAIYVLGKSSDGIALRDGLGYSLIDDSSGSVSFTRRLLFEAREMGSCEIETYVLTHTHARHASAVNKLTGIYTVRRIAVPVPQSDAERDAVESIREICAERRVELVEYSIPDGGTISFGSAVFSPLGGYTPAKLTHMITSFSLSREEFDVVYLSPSSAERSEKELSAVKSADVVIFGVHPRTRTPSEIPENVVSVAAPEADDGTLSENPGVTVLERDAEGFGSYRIPIGGAE